MPSPLLDRSKSSGSFASSESNSMSSTFLPEFQFSLNFGRRNNASSSKRESSDDSAQPTDSSRSIMSLTPKSLLKLKSSTKKVKSKDKKVRENNDEGPISLAVLMDDGILIKSRKPTAFELLNTTNNTAVTPSERRSMSSSTTSFRNSTDNENSNYLETASLISCVTCLSENMSNCTSGSSLESSHAQASIVTASTIALNNSDGTEMTESTTHLHNSYSSVNGQIPTNSVVPYSRILNARILDITKSDNKDITKALPIFKSFLRPNQHLVEITFAKPRRHDVIPKRLSLLIENESDNTSALIEEILQRSFRNTKRRRSLLVIVNPFGGKGNAKKIFMRKARPLLQASGFKIDVKYTKYSGHAVQIAQGIDIHKYDTICCASGDGIPHEVINGLYRRKDRVAAFNKLTITQIPCGSGNAMSVSCHWTNNPSYATLSLIKSIEKRVDVMRISQPSYYKDSPRISFLSQTYGIIAESDINTEFIRWMGPARFELGVALKILQRKQYPCDIYVKYCAKSKNELKSYYLQNKKHIQRNFDDCYNEYYDIYDMDENEEENLVTEKLFEVQYPPEGQIPNDWEKIDSEISNNIGIFYTGKMPYMAADTKFFPAALPSDGCMDMVITDSRTPFTRMVPILLALDKGSHVLQPEVLHSKITAYKIVPKVTTNTSQVNGNDATANGDGLFSIDGEKYPKEPLQVEVVPRLVKTLLRNGRFVDTGFDSM
ncbi:hypothetical protein KAFR_0A05250 [Kazachstania africana CBS 2517]|uniref:sphingosine kinase n=1 Tax=Kazachstania africana (strain ATCC 22294 / BCRC 22015 / CBS 2517 / CECT 1963 / NBRC 1671 / NRRL Y-8276) TaxID=1071382 RepID=H2ANL0_KAZAF|nr:hypothetical protein KAFR_0A05250 [Kazachstania africana CBS 2517]CCF55960.1 hypothetical protein KAFR_0A05250 [Kazachstania africana CBS 2517]